MLTPEQKVALEALIDKDDLASVLTEIVEICHGKAAHLEESWQDRRAAARWILAGNAVLRCALTDAVKAVP